MNTSTPPMPSPGHDDYALFIGLDWADEKHVLSLGTADSRTVEHTTLDQTPEALAAWANALRTRCPNGRIAVCLEQSRGALIAGLMAYEHLVLYPVNPKSLARFRQALHPSGSKDDPSDADLLLDLVLKHRNRLRPWNPDTAETRQLALLCEQRRDWVDRCTALTNQLRAHLKAVYPQALKLVGTDLAARLATDFLKKWPSLAAVQTASPAALRKFYYGHNSRSEERINERLDLIKSAVALTTDPALLAAHTLGIQSVVALLETLRPILHQYDQQIAQVFDAHPDAAIFDSLPGAGPVLAPRLLASLGTDRSRFPKAVALSCLTGIAPVTEKSGKSEAWVHMRWSCPKFQRQSWHEFANSSRKYCVWAQACYDHLRHKMDHHEAIRKLAYIWQRIVWRMWQKHETYDDARYLRSLQSHGLKHYQTLTLSPSAEAGACE